MKLGYRLVSLHSFTLKEVYYLGHVVSQVGVKPNDDKVKTVSTYLVPKTVKELRQFLGQLLQVVVNDYAAHIAEPLP